MLSDRVPGSSPNSGFLRFDVKSDVAGISPVQAVLADPPWYIDDVLAFLRTSARVCADKGTVFLGFGSDGTRPGVVQERERIIAEADKLGLKFFGLEPRALSYATPFFEHNALLAAQLKHVPSSWRHGDLLLFRKYGNGLLEDQLSSSTVPSWAEANIGGIEVRVRGDGRREFVDPGLIPLVPGDILPAVSRRDFLGQEADVWTTGNRVYRCEGKNILAVILKALEESGDPTEGVQRCVGRRLNYNESALVAKAVARVESIVEVECQEMWRFYSGRC